MDFYEVVAARRSIRGFIDRPVPDEVLNRIAGAVRLAPSACNRQPFKILAVRNAAIRKRICKVCSQNFIDSAPVILAMLGNSRDAWLRQGDDHRIVEVDVGIAFEHAVLAATAEGLGCCWVCAYERKKLDTALGIEEPWSVMAIAPLGYPAIEPSPMVRKPVNELFEIVD